MALKSVDSAQSKILPEYFPVSYVLPEIYFFILQKFWNPRDIMHFRETCTTWRNILDCPHALNFVWKPLFDRHHYQPLYSPVVASDSFQAFQDRYIFHSHLKQGIYASYDLVGKSSDGIRNVELTLHEGKVFISSWANIIDVWDIATNGFSFFKTDEWDPNFAFLDDKIVTGGFHGHLVIRDNKTYAKLKVLEENMGSICDLMVRDDLLIATSSSMIKIWNVAENFKCVFERFCANSPLSVFGSGKLAYSFRGSDTITIENIQDGTSKVVPIGQGNKISELALTEGKLIVALMDKYNDSQIKVLNFESSNFDLIKTLTGQKDKINILKVINRKIISCSFDAIKLWDVETLKCVRTIKHKPALNDINLLDDKIITASNDGIRIWDIRTGKQLRIIKEGRVSSLLVIEGKCIAGFFNGRVKVYDMRAEGPEIFAEIVHLLKTSQLDEASSRFNCMPREEKKPINRLLDPYLKAKTEMFLWPQITTTKKVQAIKTVILAHIRPHFDSCVNMSEQVENYFLLPQWTRKLMYKELLPATRSAILIAIAENFESSDHTRCEQALEYFFALPEKEKDRIYYEFIWFKNFNDLEESKTGFSKRKPSLNLIKAQAIRNFVKVSYA